ncbi:uncharacterized protein LOC118437306 [Folsomia candida]|nr:uncharacterized protein LOC118437306 [Folsomia candida]
MSLNIEDITLSDPITLNVDAVSVICSWLPLKDIKNCRLLSKMWDDGASTVLKNESIIRLNCNLVPNEVKRNERCVKDLVKFGNPANLHIDVGVSWEVEEYDEVNFSRVIALLKEFTCVRRLKFSGAVYLPWQNEVMETVFLNVSESVSHLEFDVEYSMGNVAGEFVPGQEFCGGKKFVHVKRLDILDDYTIGMITGLPGVKELSVVNSSSLKHLEKQGLPRLSKLHLLSLNGELELRSVLQLNRPLRTLSIYELSTENKNNPYLRIHLDLHELLCKHRNTLEYLTLELGSFCILPAGSVWKLPTFPILKRLKLLISNSDNDFDIRFDTAVLNVSTNFPQLREINLVFVEQWKGGWIRCFDSLFPPTRNEVVCRSVTHFEIRDQSEDQIYNERVSTASRIFDVKGSEIDAKFARPLEMFPKAENKFMLDLRK